MLNPYSQGWQSAGASPPTHTSFSPTIMNCIVVGPQSRPYFRIEDAPILGVSVFQNSNGQNIALVQWHQHPEVEIRNIVTRQRTSEMLSLSPDQSSRTMTVSGATVTFTTRDNVIWILRRISRGQGTVTLELTGEAIRLGLLEPAMLATFLLQYGRNID
ncbi:hypothetical protein B0H17DRAFT_927786 [Mycena rosella]|uniref:Uncharacterized protein n=1 Tax=Mycena rosella TaxID=1033263 RepID=A0AAD7GPL6_MYCRO|nr:hypothetical protein B0H17DRAFT_927786 [Mycena rosella]